MELKRNVLHVMMFLSDAVKALALVPVWNMLALVLRMEQNAVLRPARLVE